MRASTKPELRPERTGQIALMLLLLGVAPAIAQEDPAGALSARFREAARKILPAVVTVRSVGGAELILPDVPPGFPRPLLPGLPPVGRQSAASGVVLDAAKGLILTTNHAIGESAAIDVILADGRSRNVQRIARDPRSDLALLTIDSDGLNLTAAEWGDSEALDLGDWVLAIGQPFGLTGTVTSGIVGGKGRSINPSQYEDLIQTDAAMYPGSSGGPLVDLRGRVVGIATATQRRGRSDEGIGFAIPASRARRVADDLAATGRVRRSYLGVRIEGPDPQKVAEQGRNAGVQVGTLASGSPAEEAGLQVGDLIVRVGNRPIASPGELQAVIEFAPIGEPLELTIRRGDQSAPWTSIRPRCRVRSRFPRSRSDPASCRVPAPSAGSRPGSSLSQPRRPEPRRRSSRSWDSTLPNRRRS